MIGDISKNYSELEDSFLEIINRGFGRKKYKQKTKTFLPKYIPTKRACSRFIKYVKKYRRKLLLRNNILNGIFTGRKGDLEITHETLSKFDYFYFRDYWDTEIDYFKRNTGRGIVNGELEDVKLAPSHNIYYDDNPDIIFSHFYHEEVKPIPIFKLLAKKKRWTEIQNIYTLEVIRIQLASTYKIYRIIFPLKTNPDRPQKPSRIDYFFKPQPNKVNHK